MQRHLLALSHPQVQVRGTDFVLIASSTFPHENTYHVVLRLSMRVSAHPISKTEHLSFTFMS